MVSTRRSLGRGTLDVQGGNDVSTSVKSMIVSSASPSLVSSSTRSTRAKSTSAVSKDIKNGGKEKLPQVHSVETISSENSQRYSTRSRHITSKRPTDNKEDTEISEKTIESLGVAEPPKNSKNVKSANTVSGTTSKKLTAQARLTKLKQTDQTEPKSGKVVETKPIRPVQSQKSKTYDSTLVSAIVSSQKQQSRTLHSQDTPSKLEAITSVQITRTLTVETKVEIETGARIKTEEKEHTTTEHTSDGEAVEGKMHSSVPLPSREVPPPVVSLKNTTIPVENSMKRKRSRPTRADLSDQQDSGEDRVDTDEDTSFRFDNADDEDDDYGKRPEKLSHDLASTEISRSRGNRRPQLSDYELERLENIKRNQEMLLFLQLPTMAASMQMMALKEPKVVAPSRTSNRLRSLAVDVRVEIDENDTPKRMTDNPQGTRKKSQPKQPIEHEKDEDEDEDDEDPSQLMSGDIYFNQETRDNAIRVDGHYKGWLKRDVMAKYGFEASAQEAWEANGGGTFSFKDPLGLAREGNLDSESIAKGKGQKSKRPKYDAKMVSKALFKKNPNAFFYRHNEPGEEQWTGDWTASERDLFLKVTREFGCGDKWGLFASHIPHRVGYQCSNYYRQVILPEGLVFDPNYVYTSRGKPIYCGKYNQRRS
ncbi:hypothetical protein BGW38_000018 [Lunasporangiospora selenospora]|uniref:Myb-like domain-containing protein n=1 Tax=Lunasporangiospora selenospora TaxID=979761 RepID=A0A9P6KJA0_9FUNG|nr:hypothetical protein BGW38_000018 [Lunasporangiospora selenospora]